MARGTKPFAKRLKTPPLPNPLLHFVEEREKSSSVLSLKN